MKAFTLIELIMVMVLVGIMSVYIYSEIGSLDDSARFEQTQAKLKAIKKAITGDPAATDSESKHVSFGFIGDIGRLPSSLGELTTQGSLPAWVFNATYGIGAGWRGKYLAITDTKAPSSFVDGWGRAIIWSRTADPPFLMSYGSDGVAGGSVYATDIIETIPNSSIFSTVSGILSDINKPQSGATVELRRPVNGVLTATLSTTDSQGYYSFSGVPFGVRSIAVISTPTLGPNQITVDRSDYNIPSRKLGFLGTAEKISYVPGSVKSYESNYRVFILFNSTYNSDIQLKAITFTSTAGGTYSYFAINGAGETFSPAVSSGSKATITTTMIVPANSSYNSLEIYTNKNQSGDTLTWVFEWFGRTNTDTIQISI